MLSSPVVPSAVAPFTETATVRLAAFGIVSVYACSFAVAVSETAAFGIVNCIAFELATYPTFIPSTVAVAVGVVSAQPVPAAAAYAAFVKS